MYLIKPALLCGFPFNWVSPKSNTYPCKPVSPHRLREPGAISMRSKSIALVLNSKNVDTYLRAVDRETVQEMLRTLIREVLVRPGAATLHNTIPVPSGGPRKSTMTEEIALG